MPDHLRVGPFGGEAQREAPAPGPDVDHPAGADPRQHQVHQAFGLRSRDERAPVDAEGPDGGSRSDPVTCASGSPAARRRTAARNDGGPLG